ncbi:MAG: hypothetical protein KGS72_25040 [Cyanobacteria bacterium REEB67]|nr:hypothetical protein [Cyanobacteria bacterium REEB67]
MTFLYHTLALQIVCCTVLIARATRTMSNGPRGGARFAGAVLVTAYGAFYGFVLALISSQPASRHVCIGLGLSFCAYCLTMAASTLLSK